MKDICKKTFLLFCIIFTIGTIFSSFVNLGMDRFEETHIHILDRAVLTLLGSFILVVLMQYDFQNQLCRFIIPYVIFILLAMVYVRISALWVELHPNAYRDVFLNDTIAYIVVYCAIGIIRKVRRK